MPVVVAGISTRTVPLDQLERMAVSESSLPKALASLAARAHVEECVLLSTCMRTEAYVLAARYHAAVAGIRDFLAEMSFLAPEEVGDHMYAYEGDAATAHLFRVASGAESAVLGEGEILGQVRDAWEAARTEKTAGPRLAALFRHAVEVGKRARAETAIARGTTSLSQAAVSLAADRLGGVEGKSILVVGAGDMGEGMALALAGVHGGLLVANRTPARGSALARKVGGRAIALSEVAEALSSVDVVLTSTGAPDVIVEGSQLAGVIAARRGRPLLVIDLAVPRDVDPAVGDLPGVTLLDLGDIAAFAEAGMATRRAELPRVEAIIAEEIERENTAESARRAAPAITSLRARAEQIRGAELERVSSGMTGPERAALDRATKALVAKLLHEPTVRLKQSAGTAEGDRLADAIRALFDL